jgi:RNA polymerase sigma-70 factor (ECF subfamily)
MAGNDLDLVARYLRGDREAFGMVDGWISRAAWPYQRRLAGRWDDVLQDVRLEVTRLLGEGKFRGESSLRTYLWRVVSHTCLDEIRAETRWQWADLEVLELGAEPVRRQPESLPRRQEDRDLLGRVLDRVPPDCRALWKMIVEGLSYREMSRRMDVAEGTLRVRVLRCRERAQAIRREISGQATERTADLRNARVKASPNRSGEANADEL